jgi:HK97 family phage prohead protease
VEKKNFSYQVKELDQKGIVTIAIAGLNNKDSDKDIIRPGSFTKTFQEGSNRIKHVNQHDLTKILGLPLKMWETSDHAIVESKLNLEKEMVRDVFSDYKFFAEHQRTLEHSIGYKIMKTKENPDIEGFEITELKLYEYSTVTLGANENTPLVDIKNWKAEELEEYLRSNYFISESKGKYIEKLIKALRALNEPSDDTLRELFEPQNSTLETLKNFKEEKWTLT